MLTDYLNGEKTIYIAAKYGVHQTCPVNLMKHHGIVMNRKSGVNAARKTRDWLVP